MKKKTRINVDKRRQQIKQKILIFRGKVFQIMEISGTFISHHDILPFQALRANIDSYFSPLKLEKAREKSFFEKLFPKKIKNDKVLVLEFKCQYLFTGAVFEVSALCQHAEQYLMANDPNIIIIWYYLDEDDNGELIDGQIVEEATHIPVLYVKVKPPNTKFSEKTLTALQEHFETLYNKKH